MGSGSHFVATTRIWVSKTNKFRVNSFPGVVCAKSLQFFRFERPCSKREVGSKSRDLSSCAALGPFGWLAGWLVGWSASFPLVSFGFLWFGCAIWIKRTKSYSFEGAPKAVSETMDLEMGVLVSCSQTSELRE